MTQFTSVLSFSSCLHFLDRGLRCANILDYNFPFVICYAFDVMSRNCAESKGLNIYSSNNFIILVLVSEFESYNL